MGASQSQRVCLVTGASSGLGLTLSQRLAASGHRVHMLCRDAQRGRRALECVRQQSANPQVSLLVADLSEGDQVQAAIDQFLHQEQRLDWLVNNAGVLMGALAHNSAGVEMTLAANHLGHFQLTHGVLPALRNSQHGHILNVTSVNHRYGRLSFDDLENRYSFQPVLAYNRSKLAQILFTYDLHQRLQGSGIVVNCLHPGSLRTEIYRDQSRWMRWLLKWLSRSPESVAHWIVSLLERQNPECPSGGYFEGGIQKRSADASYDAALMHQVWQLSCRLTGVADTLPPPRAFASSAQQHRPPSLITKDALP